MQKQIQKKICPSLAALLACAATFAAVFLLTSCASLIGPREVEIPLARLQDSLDRKFPFTHRYAEIFDVNARNPRLTLQPDTNRVGLNMDAVIELPFANKSWPGSLSVSGSLQIDAARQAIVFAETRMDSFTIAGMDGAYSGQITKIGSMLTQQFLKNLPLYAFNADQFNYAGTRFIPTRITTRSNALVVTFEPVK